MNIFRAIKWMLIDQFTLHCGGGGGGGDGGAAERERARQKRIEDATRAVNAIFGKAEPMRPTWTYRPPTAQTGVSPPIFGGLARAAMPQPRVMDRAPTRDDFTRQTVPAATDGEYVTTLPWLAAKQPSIQPQTVFDQSGYDAAMDEWQRSLDEYNSVKNAAAAREGLYGQVSDDTRNYFSKQLAEDAEEALRDKRFLAARNGTFGSSQAIDMQRMFDRRNDRGLLEVANRADRAATDLRTSDEKSRIDLISRIVSGADQGSATSSAMSQLQTNAENARNEAQQGRMANVFAGALDAWRGYQMGAGEEAARRKFESQYGNFFANNTGGAGYQGTVTR